MGKIAKKKVGISDIEIDKKIKINENKNHMVPDDDCLGKQKESLDFFGHPHANPGT